ncbi:MAG: threonine/serine dehydratase [Gammaproteobacteria bacterium]|nr:threonine/serine dehydratase [Gammaproteobacteria bacterium]
MSTATPVFEDVLAAAERIAPHIRRTPVVRSASFDKLVGASVFFKCDNLQRTGAFKMRGASNAVWVLDENEAIRGVATHSSGNHGAALAAAAATRKIPAWIVVPENATPAKLSNIRKFSPEVIMCKPGLSNRERGLDDVLTETGANMVHPYDDGRVIAGQGTACLELLEDEPDLDLVLVPVGGGGLISGTLLVVKALCPGARVIGVEPAGADDAVQALSRGERVILDNPQTIADGLRASLGAMNFEIIRREVSDIVTVSDDEISAARKVLESCLGQPVEPSSATVAAALIDHKIDAAGLRVGVILTGGNVAADQ